MANTYFSTIRNLLKLRNGLPEMELKPCRMAPGMRELISILAGLSSMNFLKIIIFTFAGSLIWSISLTFVGYTFGKTTQNGLKALRTFSITSQS